MELNQFVAVTDDPEFCLGTTLFDTCDNVLILMFKVSIVFTQ